MTKETTIIPISPRSIRVVRGVPKNTPMLTIQSDSQLNLEDLEFAVRKNPLSISHGDSLIFRELKFRKKAESWSWAIEFPREVFFYGLGEKGGELKRNDRTFVIRNKTPLNYYINPDTDPLYINVPFFFAVNPSGQSAGVFINSTSVGKIKFKGRRVYLSFLDDNFDVFIFVGSEPRDILREYLRVTGMPHLPPLWSLGYHQSRWGFRDWREVLRVADMFRRLDIPCDGIFLDIDYMSSGRVFTWDGERFYEPRKHIDRLREMGFKVTVIVDPFVVVSEYSVYRLGKKLGVFARDLKGRTFVMPGWGGKSVLVDFTSQKARRFWGKLYVYFHEKYGVEGFKNDMNEPSPVTIDQLVDYYLQKVRFSNGKDIFHMGNVYALLENAAVRKAFRKRNKRVFIISRSGYAGIQRYAGVWTGDVWSTWYHLARSIDMILGLSLSGIPFVGADVGGFMPPFYKPSRELYIRWVQAGAFYPFMRAHSSIYKAPNEPWRFGDEAVRIAREFIRLRYRLLLYLYTQFYFAHRYGDPPVRPLFYDFPRDPLAYGNHYEFMFGPQMLIAPIVWPGRIGRWVYLPAATWIDFWSEKALVGPKKVWVETGIERIPVFVRDGSVIPMWNPRFTADEPIERVELHVYAYDTKSVEGWLYIDDGKTYDYEDGSYSLCMFRGDIMNDELVLRVRISGELEPPKFDVVLHTNKKINASIRVEKD